MTKILYERTEPIICTKCGGQQDDLAGDYVLHVSDDRLGIDNGMTTERCGWCDAVFTAEITKEKMIKILFYSWCWGCWSLVGG